MTDDRLVKLAREAFGQYETMGEGDLPDGPASLQVRAGRSARRADLYASVLGVGLLTHAGAVALAAQRPIDWQSPAGRDELAFRLARMMYVMAVLASHGRLDLWTLYQTAVEVVEDNARTKAT